MGGGARRRRDVAPALEAMGRGHFSVRDCKLQLAELWVQALGEAAEDPELRKHLRRHMREVHDFIADAIRRGQEEGVLTADRDADAEAWNFLAGGILGMVGRRVGLLDEDELGASAPPASPGPAPEREPTLKRRGGGAGTQRSAKRNRAPGCGSGGPLSKARPSCGLRKLGSAAQPRLLPLPPDAAGAAPCNPEPGVRPGCKVTSL